MIETSIRNPEEVIAEGFEAGVMPVFDENAIPDENLQDLIDYLLESTGGDTSAGGSAGNK